jgi:hypothetical protein
LADKKRKHGAIKKAIEHAANHPGHKRRHLELEDQKTEYIMDLYVLELLFVRWFARGAVPLTMIECEEFRTLLTYISKDIDSWLPSIVDIIKQ